MFRALIVLISTILGITKAYAFLQTKDISLAMMAILNLQIAILAKESVQNVQVIQVPNVKKLFEYLKKSKNEKDGKK